MEDRVERHFFRTYPRLSRSLLALLVLFLVWVVLLRWIVPMWIYLSLLPRLSDQLPGHISADSIDINPFSFDIKLHNFALQNTAKERVLGAQLLGVDIAPFALLQKRLIIESAQANRVWGQIGIDAEGAVSFSGFSPEESAEPAAQPDSNFSWELGELIVTDAVIRVVDESQGVPIRFVVAPVSVKLAKWGGDSHFTNDWSLNVVLEASTTLNARGSLSWAPFSLRSDIALSSSNPVVANHYLNRFGLALGYQQLSIDSTLVVETKADEMVAALQLRNSEIRDLSLQKSALPLLNMSRLGLKNLHAVLAPEWSVRVAEVALDKPEVHIHRDAQGLINWATWGEPTPQAEVPTTEVPSREVTATEMPAAIPEDEADESIPVDIRLIEVKSPTVHFNDDQNNIRLPNLVSGNYLKWEQVAWNKDAQTKLSGELALLNKHVFAVNATLGFLPFLADVTLGFQNMDIAGVEALAQSPFKVISGALSGDVALTIRESIEAVKASLSVSGLDLRYREQEEPVATIEQMMIQGLQWTPETQQVSIDLLRSDKAKLFAQINSKGGFSYSNDPASALSETSMPDVPTEPAKKPEFKIARVELASVALALLDLSVEPEVATELTLDALTIDNWQLSEPMGSRHELNARINSVGALRFKGHATDQGDKNLEFDFDNLPLSNWSPYVERSMGWPIYGGLANLKGKWVIDRGKKLQGDTRVRLDQLSIGPSPGLLSYIDMPIDLAIEMMKDSDGIIELDVPVSNNLDSVKVKMGGLVRQFMVQTVKEIARSPLTLVKNLASLGGGVDGVLEFEPGNFQLGSAEIRELNAIGELLAKKSSMIVVVDPVFSESDRATNNDAALTDKEIKNLASARAQAVRNYLLALNPELESRVNIGTVRKVPKTGDAVPLRVVFGTVRKK